MVLLYLTAGFVTFFVLNPSLANSDFNVVDQTCKKQLKELANSVSNFTRCAVNQATPFTFCRVCYEQFDNVRDIKNLIYEKDGCVKELVEPERYQIVSQAYDFVVGLWDESNCFGCFESDHVDDDRIGMKWNMKPKVKDFFHKNKVLGDCFKNYSGIPVNPIANTSMNISMTNLTIDIHSICMFCKPYYESLNNVYKSLINDVGGYVKENLLCTDVLSAMNRTRHEWSSKFDCIKLSYDTASVIALTIFYCFLPVIFYTAAKLHGNSNKQMSSYTFTKISQSAE